MDPKNTPKTSNTSTTAPQFVLPTPKLNTYTQFKQDYKVNVSKT